MKYERINIGDMDLTLRRDVLSMDLRASDVLECALAGQTAQEAIQHALKYSEYMDIGINIETGKPEFIYGVASDHEDATIGIPWLLATDDFKITKTWLKRCKYEVFPEMVSEYPILRNYTLSKNTDTIRWLTWLGFSFYAGPIADLTMFVRLKEV